MERHGALQMLRDLTLLLPLSTTSALLWEIVQNTITAGVIRTQEEERGLMLMARIRVTPTPTSTHTTLHCNYCPLEIEMQSDWNDYINSFIISPISLLEGVGILAGLKKSQNLWFKQTSLYGSFLNDATPLASEDTIRLCLGLIAECEYKSTESLKHDVSIMRFSTIFLRQAHTQHFILKVTILRSPKSSNSNLDIHSLCCEIQYMFKALTAAF